MANGNVQANAAVTAIGLFMTIFVFAFLESTTEALFGSLAFVIGAFVISLAMCIKLASAFGGTSKLAKYADKLFSVVPVLCIVVNGYQALQFKDPGFSGAFSIIAIAALTVLAVFGTMDAIASLAGTKFREAVNTMSIEAAEFSRRAHNVSDAMRGG